MLTRCLPPLLKVPRTLLLIGVVASLLIGFATSMSAETPANPKTKIIRELLDITEAADLGLEFAQRIQQQLAYVYPSAPSQTWQDWMAGLDTSVVTKQIVVVYEQNFTLEELSGLLAFYKTPAGRATLEKMPVVMDQAMHAAQQWGQEEAGKLQQLLEQAGHKPLQSQ